MQRDLRSASYPEMDYKWTALSVTTVGTLMAGINARIVIIGLPTIARQLSAGPEEVIWVTQAFTLASTVGLLLIGRIGDIFGRVRLYNLGFIIFAVGSALSALSFNVYQLIAFRVLQGVGGGILQGNSAAIVTDASPKGELGTMMGVNQMGQRLGNVVGLTLTGLILAVADWRGLFYVSIPIGIFGTVWAFKRLRELSTTDTQSRKIDWTGFGFFSTGLTFLLLAMTFLSYGIGGSLQGYGFMIAGVALLLIFIKAESRVSFPLLDLKLFRIRLFSAANLAQIMNSLGWFGSLVAVAFYLQDGLGYAPLQASLGVLPLDVTYLLFTVASGRLSDRYGARVFATTGLAIDTIAFSMMATFGEGTAYSEVALALFLVGAGAGLFTSPNARTIMGSVPADRRGIAAGFMRTMLQTGVTASYGLVILLMTFGIPYGSLSVLLQSSQPLSPALSVMRFQFVNGFRLAMAVLAMVNAVAILPALARDSKANPSSNLRKPAQT